MRARFDRRLTRVTGPGGAGKTTTLMLAIDDNRLDPFGIDVWYGADEHDRDPAHLCRGLASALDITTPGDVGAALAIICDAVWSMAPRDVVLIIDDVHLLEHPAAIDVLAVLLKDLPGNGHLLLSGRIQPELATARLRAHGEVLDIGPNDLTFDDEELAALIESRLAANAQVGAPTTDLPRLPALADLRLRAGPDAEAEFLWEEVLGSIGAARQRVLRAASVARTVDDALVDALSEGTMTTRDLLDGLPLVDEVATTAGDTCFRLHDVLRTALRGRCTAVEIADAARRAADVELARGNLRAATELLTETGDADAVLAAARRFALLPGMRRTFQDQLVVRSVVEATRPGSILGDLLRCESQFGELSTTTDVTRLGFELADVAERARHEGEPELEAVALYRALVWISLDSPVPEAMVERLCELAASVPFAAQSVRLVLAERAMFAGDPDTAMELLRPVEVVDPDLELVDRSGLLCSLGRPEEVGVGLTTADLASMPDGAELYMGFALWNRGQLTPEVALPIALSMTAQTLARRVVHPIVAILGVTSFMALAQGDTETAVRHVRQAHDESLYGCSAHIRAFTAMAEAATALEIEGESAAQAVVTEMLATIPMDDWPIRAYLLGLPMIYLLQPETRPALDRCRFGAALTTACAAGRALVELREHDSTAGAAALPWEQEACLRAHVLPVHLCELAVAASLAGVERAGEVLTRLPRLRASLQRVAAVSSPDVAAAARLRLGTMSIGPDHRFTVVALGPLRMFRDGEPVTAPDWERRARVRELMAIVIEHRRISRAKVAAVCWPDLDHEKAMRNLRVTLSYLQRVLEPGRTTDGAPSVVRSVGDQLALDDDVDVDVDRFERRVSRAVEHDRAGAPGTALGFYREALAGFDGEYLAGIEADWVTPTRTRLHLLALGAMLRAGELELASGEPDKAAAWATRASAISPGNERAGRLHASCLLAVGDRLGAARVLRSLVEQATADQIVPEDETWRMLRRLGHAPPPATGSRPIHMSSDR